MKTPATAVSSSSSQMKYSRTRSSIFHETSTAVSESSPVSSTSGADSPSTPSTYCTVKPASAVLIHTKRSTNW